MVPVLALALALAGEPGRDDLIRRGLLELHEERFEAALATAAEVRTRWPEEAAGYVAAAGVYQTMMRDYRVRAYEGPFTSLLREGLAVAERRVERAPSAEAYFARGTARGYKAVHRFTTGDWVGGILDAVRAVGDARRAAALDPAFADPLLPIALHDFWKAEKLHLGLFCGGRAAVVPRLERVRAEGRYLTVEAAYALQTVHYRRGDLRAALEVNDWLQERFPTNPVGLYHRGLILEGLGRDAEALAAWDALRVRLQAFPEKSEGFLAECELHRARLLGRTASPGESARGEAARAAWREASLHAAARDPGRELEGPLASFDDVSRAVRKEAPRDLRAPRATARAAR